MSLPQTNEDKQAVIRCLQQLLEGDIRVHCYGICFNLDVLLDGAGYARDICGYATVEHYVKAWPKHSGRIATPVPNEDYAQDYDKWENPLRLELVQFMIDRLEQEIANA